MNRGKAILIALDQLVNTLAGGWPDETFSSRCWRWSKDGKRDWPRRVVDGLFFGRGNTARAVTKVNGWGGSCPRS